MNHPHRSQKLLKNKYIRILPALIWMSFIFYLSSLSTTGVSGTQSQRFLILKTFHLIEYSVLFLLLRFALGKTAPAIFLSYLFALSDELHQSLVPGREGKFTDTLIDLIGIVIGLFFLKVLAQTKFFRKFH